MIRINLLPWREQERKANKIRFGLSVAGAIGLALLLIAALHIYYSNVISKQQRRNDFLQAQITQEQGVLTTLIQKKKEQAVVDNELSFLMNLRQKSYHGVQLLDELARVVPEGVSFNKIVREGTKIIIIGRAKSNLEVTLLMKNIDKSTVFQQPELTVLSSKENTSGEERTFQLKLEQQVEKE